MRGTPYLVGERARGKEREKKRKKKKKYAEQRRKLEVIELAGCGKCSVKNILLNLQVFTGTLWNSFERMKLLSNGCRTDRRHAAYRFRI